MIKNPFLSYDKGVISTKMTVKGLKLNLIDNQPLREGSQPKTHKYLEHVGKQVGGFLSVRDEAYSTYTFR